MTAPDHTSESPLDRLVVEALRIGADALEIEYRDRQEVVVAMSGGLGVQIASFPGGSTDAALLRNDLQALVRRKRTITADAHRCELRGSVYDSFGERAFRVEIRRSTPGRGR